MEISNTTENLVTKCYSVKTGTVIDIYKSISMNSLDKTDSELKQLQTQR